MTLHLNLFMTMFLHVVGFFFRQNDDQKKYRNLDHVLQFSAVLGPPTIVLINPERANRSVNRPCLFGMITI
jgi:hypothetical protein